MAGSRRDTRPVFSTLRVDEAITRQNVDPDPAFVVAQDLDCVPPYGVRIFAYATSPLVAARFSGHRLAVTRPDGVWVDEVFSDNATWVAITPDPGLAGLNPVVQALNAYSADFGFYDGTFDGLTLTTTDYAAGVFGGGTAGLLAFVSASTPLTSRIGSPFWIPPGFNLQWSNSTVATSYAAAVSLRVAGKQGIL